MHSACDSGEKKLFNAQRADPSQAAFATMCTLAFSTAPFISSPTSKRSVISSKTSAYDPSSNPYSISQPPDLYRTRKAALRSCETLSQYLLQRPIASHNRHAFARFLQWRRSRLHRPLLLDSGCGTGRSSLHLARLFPHCDVVGVDRSEIRLQRTQLYRIGANITNEWDTNVMLVRAELIDFWRLCLKENIWPEYHYLLYPNPYPKPRRFKVG